jgi:hypothetical protein
MNPVSINQQYLVINCTLQQFSSGIKIALTSPSIYGNSYNKFKIALLVFAPFKILPNFVYDNNWKAMPSINSTYNNFGIAP